MKPVHAIETANAAPIRSHGRTRAVELLISERNALIRDAARFYPGCTDREVARQLLIALARYRNGRWRRDRVEATCPAQHRGKLVQALWLILKTRDVPVSERTIRRALAAPTRGPRFEV
ncbi:hypothetical protein ACVMII_000797 [Bradyrhizobium diazoefficiens]